MRIILASKSPRRKELLSEILDNFEVISSDLEEKNIKDIIKEPLELVERLSIVKAEDIFNKEQLKGEDLFVVGGDTIVYLDGELMGKPKSKEDAFNMLSKLQGKTNEVYTGLGIMIKIGNKIIREVYSNKTSVKMKQMSNEEILEYISTGEPMDKAGSYAVQGIGAKYIERIDGNYNAVVGMDTDKLKEVLEKYI